MDFASFFSKVFGGNPLETAEKELCRSYIDSITLSIFYKMMKERAEKEGKDTDELVKHSIEVWKKVVKKHNEKVIAHQTEMSQTPGFKAINEGLEQMGISNVPLPDGEDARIELNSVLENAEKRLLDYFSSIKKMLQKGE